MHMNTVEGYIILNRNINKIVKRFINCSCILIILLIIISTKKYSTYYNTISLVKKLDNKYNLVIYTNTTNLKEITDKNKIYINDKIYIYNIKEINIISPDNIEVLVEIKKYKDIDNNIIEVKFLKESKELYKYITYLIKGSD